MQQINASKVPYGESDSRDYVNNPPKMAEAKIPQGYDAKINFRLVPGRDIMALSEQRGCQPRQGAPRRNAEPVGLPADLIAKLQDSNKKVISWLSLSEANANLFMSRPVEALVKAGVELSRSEQKALERSHREVSELNVVAPGVKVTQLSAAAFPKGRVGEFKPEPKKIDGPNADCGCEPKTK